MAESITKRMREYTRVIHKVSDDLVNAKLAFGELNHQIRENFKTIY